MLILADLAEGSQGLFLIVENFGRKTISRHTEIGLAKISATSRAVGYFPG
jgi:hypothetical protein